jgi:predicted  nucleic acid-binding Zn-ribbon protein
MADRRSKPRRLTVLFASHFLRNLALVLLASLALLPLGAVAQQAPRGGTPIVVPAQGAVIIEAEDFDNGGQDVAYHDNVAGNLGGQYRTSEDVDIVVNPAGGFKVNNFETGEWLEYTVSIQAAGQYEIAVRASSNWAANTPRFHIEIDDRNVTGSVNAQLTGGWNTFEWNAKGGISLPAGVHVLKLVSDAQYFDVDQIRVTATPTTPFAGVISLPTTFDAENFDNGGEGLAYHDNVAGNLGGQYRTSESVDIIASDGGFVVNNFETGEWLLYTVSVASPGLYDIDLRAATGATTSARFHIEIDGIDVTGSVAVPPTGSFGTYDWIGKRTVELTAGQHVLKLFSDQQHIDVNQIRVTQVTHRPFSGTPIALPGEFEAEDFDDGGEGNAYHDNVAGNLGGQYRTSESVDIIASDGGFVVNNFETGEWLVYTVNVTESGNYDIELRAATGATTSARYHIEIDSDVRPSIALPATGSFGTYEWIGRQTVHLAAGQHTLKLFSDQQYFDVNRIRVTAPTAHTRPAELLFYSGFEGEGITLSAIAASQNCDSANCFQNMSGIDSVTGDAWPPQRIPQTRNSSWKLRAGGIEDVFSSNPQPSGPNAIGNWMFNRIESVIGHTGASTKAQYSEIKKNCFGRTGGQEGCSTQDTYMGPSGNLTEELPDMYISFWRKLQPDLKSKLNAAGEPWHVVFEWKTFGDRRVIAQIVNWEKDQDPYFQISSDTDTQGGGELWRCPFKRHTTDPDPLCNAGVHRIPSFGGWFKFEVFWHRSTGSDGRVWMAVNGVKIVDRFGPNMATKLIDRIMFLQLYSGVAYPVFQWTDDVQIWSKVPVVGVDTNPGDPWFDPPYGCVAGVSNCN